MGTFVAAKQRVEMASAKTWLEQVHGNNIARRTMMANHPFHDEVYLGKTDGRFNDVPKDFREIVWTGTAAVIGTKGRKLGKVIETPCEYAGKVKLVRFEPTEEQQAADPNIVFMCNQGFAKNGSLYLPFSNARTNKPIVTDEEMQGAEVVNMKFDGMTFQRKVTSRNGGAFEQVGDENSLSWFSDNAVLGLLRRDGYVLDLRRWCVCLGVIPSVRLRVALDAADAIVAAATMRPLSEGQSGGSAPLESVAPVELKLTRESSDTLIIKGTPEQLDAAVRLLGQLGKQ